MATTPSPLCSHGSASAALRVSGVSVERVAERLLQAGAALLEGLGGDVLAIDGEQIEGDEVGRRLLGEAVDA